MPRHLAVRERQLWITDDLQIAYIGRKTFRRHPERKTKSGARSSQFYRLPSSFCLLTLGVPVNSTRSLLGDLQCCSDDRFRPVGSTRKITGIEYLSTFGMQDQHGCGRPAIRRIGFHAVVVHPKRREQGEQIDQV